MLPLLTYSADLIEMAASLWIAFYLFARGYPNQVTMRLVISSLALSAFFLSAYHNFFFPVMEFSNMRSVLLVIAITCWYSATLHFVPQDQRANLKWVEKGVYLLSIVSAVLLIAHPEAFSWNDTTDMQLYVPPMQIGPTFFFYGCTLLACGLLLPYNILINQRARYTDEGKLLLLATLLPSVTSIWKLISLLSSNMQMLPRLLQDILTFAGVFITAISVIRHHSLVERRTILEEFPLTTAIVAGMTLMLGTLGIYTGIPLSSLGNLTALIIITLGIYDVGHEFLDRIRTQGIGLFRKQLRTIDTKGSHQEKIQRLIVDELDLLCNTLNTDGGVVAVYRGEKALIIASRNSLSVGIEVQITTKTSGELWRSEGQIPNVEWLSSIYEGRKPIALVGIGLSRAKIQYSSGDLEVFLEFADHAGTIISVGNLLSPAKLTTPELIEERQIQNAKMNSVVEDMIRTVSDGVESELVKMVDDALRKFSDFGILGQSPLAEWIEIDGGTFLERGKLLQQILHDAVEALRPSGTRPTEDPIPRSWYAYLILHDAYIKGVPNRDIRAQLYISEGTFHRTRRSAVRGVARWVAEKFDPIHQSTN